MGFVELQQSFSQSDEKNTTLFKNFPPHFIGESFIMKASVEILERK